MRKNFILWITLLALCCLFMSGCAALVAGGAAGGGTYVYVTGQLKKDYQTGLEQTYEAALAAVDELDMVVEKKSLNLSDADIRARKGEEKIFIGLEAEDPNTTEVSVRVGLLGDEEASKRVHEAIARNL